MRKSQERSIASSLCESIGIIPNEVTNRQIIASQLYHKRSFQTIFIYTPFPNQFEYNTVIHYNECLPEHKTLF